MTAIPFPLSSAPGRVPQEGAGRLLNCFAEPLGDGRAVWARCPGLTRFATSTQTGFCGGLQVAGTLYTAWNGHVATFTSGGTETVLTGTLLTTTSKGFWARNNKSPLASGPDVVFVDPDNSHAYTVTASAVSLFADVDVATTANSVCFQHGYFFFTTGDGTVWASDLNSVVVQSLAFTVAEAKPDGAQRAIPWQDQLYIFGPSSIEIYQDTANTPPAFPYSLVNSMSTGLAGRYAVAGHEDGFGGKGLLWVADDNTVVILNGYQPNKVSPPQLDRLIAAVADKNTLEACVYISGGHPKWVLSCDAWTWEFDLNTQKWNERASYEIARWRGTQAVYAFGQWIVGDTTSGKLLGIDNMNHTEDGDPLLYRIESGPVQSLGKGHPVFPNRTVIPRADFDFATGTGIATGPDPIATQPRVRISWSDNGGVHWGNPLHRELGVQGRGEQRVTVTRTGMTGPMGRRWRLDVTDPVHVGLMGGDQATQLRVD
jgi:hypothetical protein